MKRIDIDKEFKAKTAEKAAEKFAKVLIEGGYEWAASEMIESVENNCFACSNATEHNVPANGQVTHPKTHDWTYYWALDNIYENVWYGWFIEVER